jgi:hypothetical protein
MKHLNHNLVEKIRKVFKGARLAKFNDSITVINQSLEQGSWVKRGSVKGQSGFYQGVGVRLEDGPKFNDKFSESEFKKYQESQNLRNDLSMSLSFGRAPRHDVQKLIKILPAPILKKFGVEFFEAWLELCKEKQQADTFLNSARPKPQITAIGLSPKVTKTLTEMNLDLDLASITPAEIDFVEEEVLNPITKKMEKEKVYFVKWSKGIVHGQSRFAHSGTRICHACGKPIPSGRFVPIEAKDKKLNKRIALWIGVDCSRNIFGIKDLGIKQPSESKA